MEIVLAPIREFTSDYVKIEDKIFTALLREIYWPLEDILKKSREDAKIQNSMNDLLKAIESGQVYFDRGVFRGRFSTQISKELKKLGATWDTKKHEGFRIHASKLPPDVRSAIDYQNKVYTLAYRRTMAFLRDPEKIAEKTAARVHVEEQFAETMLKTERQIAKTLRGITVEPNDSKQVRDEVSREYQNQTRYYIKNFVEKETKALRKQMRQHIMSGKRYEDMVDTIQGSYSVSKNKAKFLARQETGLLMAKYKAAKYKEVGVTEYEWTCVKGTPAHPVRPMHKKLDGKRFSFDNPPIVNEEGQRKNPGEDYNCRCVAKPVVKF